MGSDDDRGKGGWWPSDDEAPDRPEQPSEPREPRRPPRGLASPDRPRPSGRYSMFVGLAFVALIVVALLNLLNDDSAGIELERGLPLAEFAVPDALAGIDADANVAQDDCESSRNPCPEDDRRTPACRIDSAGAIRVCDLFDRPLAISFWFTRGGDCVPSQDAFDAVADRYRDGSTSSASTSATIPRRSPGSSATTAGRCPSASTATAPSRTSTGSASARPSSSPSRAGSSSTRRSAPATTRSPELSGLVDRLLAASKQREQRVR